MNTNQRLSLARAIRSAKTLPDAGRAALLLAQALQQDLHGLFELDQRLPSEGLLVRVLGLPLELCALAEFELALAVARAFAFAARAELDGDVAVILASAGRREEALAQVDRNLSAAENSYVAEAKAGDTYRALGEPDAAEAYYRRALALASESDRSEAVLRIVSLLIDTGRVADANAFLKTQGGVR